MTEQDTRIELLESVLTAAADVVEDLTGPAMELFYARFPDARASFEYHGLGKREQVEAQMVENSVFFLMGWLEREPEVANAVHSSVRHHNFALRVPPEWYRGLLGSVIDVIVDTVPDRSSAGSALIEDIRAGLYEVISEGARSLPVRR